jgi:hypothetical protein
LAVAAAAVTVRAARVGRRLVPPHGVAIDVLDGSVQRDLATDLRRYRFAVALRNHSPLERTIAAAGLRVSYRTRANFLGAVDLPLSAAEEPTALRMPLRLRAGEMVTGTAQLETSNIIPRHCRVEGYALLLVDDAGHRWQVPASLPQVLENDHDGDGPRTWGWD